MAGKATAKQRGYGKSKKERKRMKESDLHIRDVGKKALQSGKKDPTGASPKSQSPTKPKVPVKPRGGMRGGVGSGPFGPRVR